MFDPLARIQSSAFPPISFLSKSEWKRLGNCPASDLNFSSAEVMDVEDKYATPISRSIFFLRQLKVVHTDAPLRLHSYQRLCTY